MGRLIDWVCAIGTSVLVGTFTYIILTSYGV